MPSIKARYWMLTIPTQHQPEFPEPYADYIYAKGQKEIAPSGLIHWQAFVQFSKPVTLNLCKAFFCTQAHCEPSRSKAAEEYVWKESTRVPYSQFEFGRKPLQRNSKTDWETVRTNAKNGNFDDIDPDVFVRHYTSLKRIRVDYTEPIWRENIEVSIYWGGTALGKTRRAWHEAGSDVYVKDPNTKWWDGYKGEANVIIDEFTGVIAINHILRWLDRYPCMAEVKGYSTPLRASKFWITSNVDPRNWYPEANDDQRKALLRRCNITHFIGEWIPPPPSPSIELTPEVDWNDKDENYDRVMENLFGDEIFNDPLCF